MDSFSWGVVIVLAAPVLTVGLVASALSLVTCALVRAVPTTSAPVRTVAGLRWSVTHTPRLYLAVAVQASAVLAAVVTPAGVVTGALLAYVPPPIHHPDSVAVRNPPPWWVASVAWAGAPFVLAWVAAPIAARRWRAVVTADRCGLRVERPWPFRSRSWRWDEVLGVEPGQGALVVVTTAGARHRLRVADRTQSEVAEVADWLDQHPDPPASEDDPVEVPDALRSLVRGAPAHR